MFTGLIQGKGTIIENSRSVLVVRISKKPALGASIAINGVCLTVAKFKKAKKIWDIFFDVSKETLSKTSLGKLSVGTTVNIEGALAASQALGGHIVQGHVDGVGSVASIDVEKGMKNIYFKAPKDVMTYVVDKGSITVDGVSLTAIEVTKVGFSVALIPMTLKETTLGKLKKNDQVNLEADIIGKYVKKFLKK